MSQPPPLVPNYLPPLPPALPPRGYPLLEFLGGAAAGTIVSAVTWIITFYADKTGSSILIFLVLIPVVKVAMSITFLCLHRWRMLGAGILVSLPLGALIFFGVCASNIKF
jgi:hypothetical protein